MKILLLILSLSLTKLIAQTPEGEVILEKVDNNLGSENKISLAEMHIKGQRGNRSVISKSWIQGRDQSFTEYLDPPREKGTKMLKIDVKFNAINYPEEALSKSGIKATGRGGVGAEHNYYTVKLTNAAIAGMRFIMPSTFDPFNAKIPEYEEVSFTYQKIEWTWNDGGITATDDWEAPVV